MAKFSKIWPFWSIFAILLKKTTIISQEIRPLFVPFSVKLMKMTLGVYESDAFSDIFIKTNVHDFDVDFTNGHPAH